MIVGLNTNKSIKMFKGDDRPINDENDRAYVLASLTCVDYVVLFDDKTPINIIRELNPDILVKGGDYDSNETDTTSIKYIVGKEYAKKCATINTVEGYSTTNIINSLIKPVSS
jgi:D-beta-D-heptose 7-phosphate kinase/D-beta-D-heptose 1-phosphate adenosyltransferase